MTVAKESLNDNHYRLISTRLSTAIGNKKNSHVRDLRKAAVLFYNINRHGFIFVDNDVFRTIDNFSDSNQYSPKMRITLGNLANACNYLVDGLDIYRDDNNIKIPKTELTKRRG